MNPFLVLVVELVISLINNRVVILMDMTYLAQWYLLMHSRVCGLLEYPVPGTR